MNDKDFNQMLNIKKWPKLKIWPKNYLVTEILNKIILENKQHYPVLESLRFGHELKIEFSNRLIVCAGKCYSIQDKNGIRFIIRLNSKMLHSAVEIFNTLQHEFAHVITRFKAFKSKTKIRSHGPEFRQVMDEMNSRYYKYTKEKIAIEHNYKIEKYVLICTMCLNIKNVRYSYIKNFKLWKYICCNKEPVLVNDNQR
mgnify:CR=1 FL=1